ncbi:GMC oxidoreductase [Paenibacillus sp. LHD-38]|uniref:GMC oxidoreductase n=1 Tax=Paenibacillus sp. LHD-38 TaxID=3072143 RepID=UPI00280D42DC|nr:GMC oxidoreductase [Paenibacillus sp. LHD-38]MDQ8736408.1 GMC oxidoreductase [Paenibacillus sp. LHD-38]
MRIYVAKDGDTLIRIAEQFNTTIESLLSLNAQIGSPGQLLSGEPIYLPTHTTSREYRTTSPFGNLQCPVPWFPTTPPEEMEKNEYDVLIVGTGAGGGAVLWRLCEQWGANGKRIGVVEAGDLTAPTHAANLPYFDADLYTYTGQSHPQFPGTRQVIAFGGRTLLWGLISPRVPDFALAEWPIPVKEMKAYYNIAEKLMNVTQNFQNDSSLQEVLLGRLQNHGFLEAQYAPIAADLTPTKYGVIHSNVSFSSIQCFASGIYRRPFDLAVKSRAVQVYVENGRAVGVRVMQPDGKSYVIRAKNIVLSAGALENPRILLNSGIEGRAIGHYLTGHTYVRARGKIETKDFPDMLGTLDILIPQTLHRPFQIQIDGPYGPNWFVMYQQYKERPFRDDWEITLYGFGKTQSRYENRVAIDPLRRDEYGIPLIQIDFSYSDKDLEIRRQSANTLQQAAAAMGVPIVAQEGQPAIQVVPPGGDQHESGTCRMGFDPDTSATNPYGQVHGVQGLYAADLSVLPTLNAANPTLSVVALAIRTADYIVSQLN